MKALGKRTQHDSAVGRETSGTLFVDDLPSEKNEMFVDYTEQAEQNRVAIKRLVNRSLTIQRWVM